MMRRLIAAFAAALFAFAPLAASAQTLIRPSGIVSGAPTTCASEAVSTPCLNISQAWTGAGTFTLDVGNVSADSGPSNAASLLIDRQYLGVSKFSVRRDGVIFGVALQTTGDIVTTAGNFSLSSGQKLQWNSDTVLTRDAANTLALRNGVNAQTFNVYNTFTDASNYERALFSWQGNKLYVGMEKAGTGSGRTVSLFSAAGLEFATNAVTAAKWSIDTAGNFTAGADNTYDIGASGANRPRNVFVAGYIVTQVTTVASLTTCAAGLKGARSFVTDANATTFLSAVAGGGANNVPVVCDGTSWKIG